MLFRKESLDNQLDKLHGDVIVTPKFSVPIIITILIFWICLIAIWLFSANYARKETVLGWLEPADGIHRVFAESSTGTVSEVMVTNGQNVNKDDALFVISNTKTLGDGNYLEQELLQEYQSQKQAITDRMAREKTINTLEIEQLSSRINNLQDEILQAEQQLNTLNQVLDLVNKRETNYTNLQQPGYVSKDQLMSVKEQKLSVQSDYQALIRNKLNLQHSLSELTYQQSMLPQQHQNEIAQLNQQLSELNQNILQLNGQQKYVVRAKVSGIVSNLQVQKGEAIPQNIPLATISPLNNQLFANLLVPVSSAGFLKQGQNLKIRYDAFPYQKFGLFDGHIQTISSSIMLPNEIMHSHIAIQEPVYLIKASVSQSSIQAYNQTILLKSGMTLSADIVLDNRNLVEWLLEPIFSVQGRL